MLALLRVGQQIHRWWKVLLPFEKRLSLRARLIMTIINTEEMISPFVPRHCAWSVLRVNLCLCSGGADGAVGGVCRWPLEGRALRAHCWCLQAHHPHLRTAQGLWGYLLCVCYNNRLSISSGHFQRRWGLDRSPSHPHIHIICIKFHLFNVFDSLDTCQLKCSLAFTE